MSMRVHVADADALAIALNPDEDMYVARDEGYDGEILAIEDAGNGEALLIMGSHEQLERFARDLVKRVMPTDERERFARSLLGPARGDQPTVNDAGDIEVRLGDGRLFVIHTNGEGVVIDGFSADGSEATGTTAVAWDDVA